LSRAQHVAKPATGQFRDGCLDQRWFASLEEARHTIETWRLDYNTKRPHRALGQQTPAAWMIGREHLLEAAD
jgi:putative transposase